MDPLGNGGKQKTNHHGVAAGADPQRRFCGREAHSLQVRPGRAVSSQQDDGELRRGGAAGAGGVPGGSGAVGAGSAATAAGGQGQRHSSRHGEGKKLFAVHNIYSPLQLDSRPEPDTEYKKAVDCLLGGRRRKIDVGTCHYYDGRQHLTRYFVNAINIGLGARIVKITDQCKRFWGVKALSYFMALLSIIFERKLYRMHLKINGEHIRGRIMTVCIGSAWGYGQAPSAVPYNGWLDVSVIYRPELLQLWSGLWMLIQGRILNHKVVKPYRTQKVKVLRAQNASVDLDGRILDRHFPLDIGVMHEAITLIIPN